MNNNQNCYYDDGDCCGAKIKKNFCVECKCKCKQKTKIDIKLKNTLFNLYVSFQILLARQMKTVMVMVTAKLKTNYKFANATLITCMHWIAQFLAVSYAL